MAIRTTSKMVIDILGSNYDNINCPSLIPYLKTANQVVTRVIDCIEQLDDDLTIDEAAMMEAWLAAYFYTITDPIYKSKQTGNSSATYGDRSYLDGALALDPTSCLSSQMKGTYIGFTWLGKTPADQVDVDDRVTD